MKFLDSEQQHIFVETNNIRLHCVAQGEGELVLLLHGFPEFWYSWRQIPALARHFKVVVPDLRGYNDSDKPESGYDLDTLSADIRGLIDRLGYTKAHIVGHDWGGVIAWHLAQKFPEKLNSLAILNAPHPQRFVQEMVSNLDQIRRSWYVLAFQVPGIPEWLIQQNLKNFVTMFSKDKLFAKELLALRKLRFIRRLWKSREYWAAVNYYRQMFHPQRLWNLGQKWETVKVPTLVLWGEEDAFLRQTCRRFRQLNYCSV